MEKIYKPEDVADILQVSPRTVKDWLRAGEIRGIKMGKLWRIEQSALDEYLKHSRELRAFHDAEIEKRKSNGSNEGANLSIRCDSCGHMFMVESMSALIEKAAQGEFPTCPKCDLRVEQNWLTQESAQDHLEYQEKMRQQYGRTWAEFEEKLKGGD